MLGVFRTKNELSGGQYLGIVVVMAAAYIEWVAFLNFIHRQFLWEKYALVHVGVFCAIAAYNRVGWKRRWDIRLSLFALPFIALMGPFGGGIVCLSSILHLIYKRMIPSLVSLLKGLFPDINDLELSEKIYNRIVYRYQFSTKRNHFFSFQDIMEFGTLKQKQTVIENCIRNYSPQFHSILEKGVKDKENTVRILSAMSLITLSDQFENQMKQFKGLYEETESVTHLLKYAEMGKKFVESNLLSQDRLTLILQKTIGAYEEYLDSCPEDESANFALAKLYRSEKREREAISILEQMIRNGDEVSPNVFLELMKSYFKIGNYTAIRRLNDSVSKMGRGANRKVIEGVLHAWSG